MIGINEELKTIEAARAVLSTDQNSKATIKVLREAKYVAALAMTTLASDKPLNDARHVYRLQVPHQISDCAFSL
jgi:hypothetical protein